MTYETEQSLTERRTGKIAYIILCHDEPEILRKVALSLKYGDDRIFVHVDKKTDISPFVEMTSDLENVRILSSRVDVSWGGFSSIVATMELFREVLRDDIVYDRIVLLQGKDYPLHSPRYIHSFFDERKEEEFCKAKNITESADPRDYMKVCGYWDLEGRKNTVKKIYRRVLSILNCRLKIKYRKGFYIHQGQKWNIYKGWAQIALTRSCAEYVLNAYDTMPKLNKFFRHRFPPDEMYIHTILYNSPYRNKISDYSLAPRDKAEWFDEYLNLTYFEYPYFVTVFKDAQEYQGLLSTKALFFRKVTYQDSLKLLDEIDKQICKE